MVNQLVQIYLLVCQIYDNSSTLKSQRASNIKPRFSDEKIITVYLFGQLNEKFTHRQIYNFIRYYCSDWFPALLSYQAFNCRLNLLIGNFQVLFAHLLQTIHLKQSEIGQDYLIDSMPIMLASGIRSKRARVTPEIVKCGFSDVKQSNFRGVRLHLICQSAV